MSGIAQSIRFPRDHSLYKQLMENTTIRTLAEKRMKNDGMDQYRRKLLGHSLRVTPAIAPDLFSQVEQAKEKLGLQDKQTEVYIYSDEQANASCFYMGGERIVLTFSSGLLKGMNSDEINFVVGHELGHALFEHYSLPSSGILNEDHIDAELALKLMSWSRHAEISADRAGLYVCGKPEAAISSFLKLSCGVAHPVISFNVEEYLSQVRDIEDLSNKLEDLSHCYSTHPFNPIRVLAVDLYAKANSSNNPGELDSYEDVDREVENLLMFMEPVPEDKRKRLIDNCLLWAGLWVAHADDNFSAAESENLQQMFEREEFLDAVAEIEHAPVPTELAKLRFKQSVSPLTSLPASDKCSFLQRLVVVARCDQIIDERETDVLHQVCDALSIERSFVQKILMFLD